MHIKWSPPSYLGGAPIKSYRVEVTPGTPAHAVNWVEAYNGPDREVMISGCPPGMKYLARVCASNSAGNSPFSTVGEYTTEAAIPLCSAACEAELVTAAKVRLMWSSADGQGAPVMQYRVEMAMGAPAEEVPDFQTIWSGTALTAEVKNLRPCTSYLFRLQVNLFLILLCALPPGLVLLLFFLHPTFCSSKRFLLNRISLCT